MSFSESSSRAQWVKNNTLHVHRSNMIIDPWNSHLLQVDQVNQYTDSQNWVKWHTTTQYSQVVL